MTVDGPTARRYGRRAIQRERLLVGFVLSLALLVVLVNLPIGSDSQAIDLDRMRSATQVERSEIPIVTIHELPDAPVSESVVRPSLTPPADVDEATGIAIPSGDGPAHRKNRALERPVVLRPTTEIVPLRLPSEERTRKLLRHTFGPPAVDEPPRVRVGSMFVRYPLSALKKAVEGLVIVRFVVETSGRASGIRVVKGLDPACDAEVVQAIENARFLPGKREGKEVPAFSQMTVRFVLEDSRRPMGL